MGFAEGEKEDIAWFFCQLLKEKVGDETAVIVETYEAILEDLDSCCGIYSPIRVE